MKNVQIELSETTRIDHNGNVRTYATLDADALLERLNAGGMEEQEAANRIRELEAQLAEVEARLKDAEGAAETKIRENWDKVLDAVFGGFTNCSVDHNQERMPFQEFVNQGGGACGICLTAKLAAAEAEAARLRGALEQVEWVRTNNGWDKCPWCLGYIGGGHKPDCARQSALEPARQSAAEGEAE